MALSVSEIETCISDVLTNGQSTTQDGTTFTAANLQYLIELRDNAKREAAATSGARPLIRAVNMNSMGYSNT